MSAAPTGAELLDRPAQEAVRRVALRELERASEAAAALVAGDDPEALHDFRVALRRLRSQLRAFRGVIGSSVPKRIRRQLAKLARATGPGRDAEVSLEWLERLFPAKKEPRFGGAAGRAEIRRRLVLRHANALTDARERLVPRFERMRLRLVESLSSFTVALTSRGDGHSFRELLAAEIDRHRLAFHDALEAIPAGAKPGVAPDDEPIHVARIEAKRLRYVVEPAADGGAQGENALAALKGAQDLFGELNDLRVLAHELGVLTAELERDLVARVANEGGSLRKRRPKERRGLLDLAESVAEARVERRVRLLEDWVVKPTAARAALETALAELERSLVAESPAADDAQR